MCGTNTDVGKTYITNLIIKKIMYQRRVGAYKPIESGCNKREDFLFLMTRKSILIHLKGDYLWKLLIHIGSNRLYLHEEQ